MIRYAITGADSASPTAATTARLTHLAAHWTEAGLDYVQLRQKHMAAGELTLLARKLIATVGGRSKLLINHRADVALAAGAAGVHLTSHPDELTPAQVRQIFSQAGAPEPILSVSCHTLEDIARARDGGATLALFGPVFEKPLPDAAPLTGVALEALREACRTAASMPVLALGGITRENTAACIDAGAAGIAAIRLFA